MSEIDARAIISPATRLGRCVRVSAYAVVGNEVELGDGCVLHPHAVVNGPARLGRENVLHPFCSVGGDPQDLKYGGERTELVVRSEEHTSELQSRGQLVCRLLLEKKKIGIERRLVPATGVG